MSEHASISPAEILDILTTHEALRSVSKLGYCREWTRMAYIILMGFFSSQEKLAISLEAREKYISPSFPHTFLRIAGQDFSLLADGTGVEKHPPYFGSETDAPDHLQASHPDIMNNYLPDEYLKYSIKK